MANVNEVILIGNLTRSPEVKTLPSGATLCEWGMAINRKYKSKDGQDGEEVCFVDCTAFGRTGEVVNQYVKKGEQLYVRGRLKFDQWEKDGMKRSKLSVTVENVQLLSSGKQEGGDSQGAGGAAAAPQAPLPVAAAGSDTLPF